MTGFPGVVGIHPASPSPHTRDGQAPGKTLRGATIPSDGHGAREFPPPPRDGRAPRRSFFSRVEFTDGCWLWLGGRNSHGYGVVRRSGRSIGAHRYAFELLVGPIPDGLQIDHLCRVRNCVNPAHMEPVTSRENTLRGFSPSAECARKTHCKHGHEFTPENTYVYPNGKRKCRTCKRALEVGRQRPNRSTTNTNGHRPHSCVGKSRGRWREGV